MKLESLKRSRKDRIITLVSMVCRVQLLGQIESEESTLGNVDGPTKEDGPLKVGGHLG